MSIDTDTMRQMIAEDELGLLDAPAKVSPQTPDERLIASFKEIADFVKNNGREPALNAADMGESKLFWRLEAIVGNEDQREMLKEHDELGLLKEAEPPSSVAEVIADDPEGLLDDREADIFTIRHVPSSIGAPDMIAQRERCEDFSEFEPLFKKCHAELQTGVRKLIEFRNEQQIRADTFYVLSGVLVYVAEVGERKKSGAKYNARLRCIFENGTESRMLLRSLARGLYKNGKGVTDPEEKTLEAMNLSPETPVGVVYVLKSLSGDPQVKDIPHLHKIGCTTGTADKRTKNSMKESTFLGSPVEIVAEYEMPAGMAQKVEALLHRFFSAARLDAWFERDGLVAAEAKEWFSVPIDVIDESINLIESESIQNFQYDQEEQSIKIRS